MLTIYLKSYNKVLINPNLDIFEELGFDDILWIDMLNPTIKEKKVVEDFMDFSLQTRQQVEEIEYSSRYSESERATFLNTNFLVSTNNTYIISPVSFAFCEGVLVSERSEEFKTFVEVAKRLQINHRSFPTGAHVLVTILEVRIDMDADMIESISRKVSALSRTMSIDESNVDSSVLRTINSLQDSNMILRENIFDRQRTVSSISRSERFPNDTYPRLSVMLKDIASLLSHADFSLNRLDYLQDTAMGLINIEQNNITKLFTVASVFFLPLTLIASIYGMNFTFMPEVEWKYGYFVVLGLMVVISTATYIVFKRKKWL